MDMKKLLESMSQFEGSEMDRSPGSPYDRGNADGDYGRSPRPHKMVPNEQGGRDMQKLTDPEEIEEYYAGYEAGDNSKPDPLANFDDDLDEAKDEDLSWFTDYPMLDLGQSRNTVKTNISDKEAAKKIADKIQMIPNLTIPKITQYVKRYLSMVGKNEKNVPYLTMMVYDELEDRGSLEEDLDEGQQLDEIGDDPKSKFSKLLPKVAKRGLNRSLKAFRQGDDENLFKYSDVLNRADARMSSGGSNYLPKKSTKSSDSGDGKYDEAQLYHDEFEDHMHANHGARLEGDDETALEHLEAAEEAAENYFNTTGKKIVSSDYDGDSPYITNSDLSEDLDEGIVGTMKKLRNALKIPTGADRFPGAEIPARAINAIQRNRTASALKNMNKVGDNPDSTASDFGRAVTDYGQRRDNMTGREKVGESLTVTATDNDAYSLMRMVSLAGVPGAAKVEPIEPYSPYSKPVTGVIYNGDSTGCSAANCSDSNCPTHGHDMMPMEEYANEPDESTCEVSSVTDNAGLGGLNGPKKQYPFAANRSENPLATNEYDIAERATMLASMYNKFKGK